MLAVATPPAEPRPSSGAFAHARASGVRRLARGETLFHTGDDRDRLYRVERGALCHYVRWDDGHHEVIEFAFPGDIIGFGHLAVHTSTAQAVAKTIVSPISEAEFERLLETDGQLAARFAAAGDREFDFMRVRSIESGRGNPTKRVAAFLAALARLNADEGRNPGVITEEFSSGAVAGHLNMTIGDLAQVLRQLESDGLVASDANGLRISDIDALEQYADAA
jgi:CRP/FNR family transcriptional regulator, anaerobic regulatory protein